MSDETGQVLAIAQAWLTISDGETIGTDGPTNRFVALWIAFNALYALHFDEFEHDSQQVRAFGRWSEAMAVHRQSLRGSEYSQAIEDLSARGVFNYRRKQNETLVDRNDLERVMVLVYQVRCNLFHGRKYPADLRDQTLIRAAHTIIRKLVVSLLDQENYSFTVD
jgi:hypothetical protein